MYEGLIPKSYFVAVSHGWSGLVRFQDRLQAFGHHTASWVAPLSHTTVPTLVLAGVASALASLAIPATNN